MIETLNPYLQPFPSFVPKTVEIVVRDFEDMLKLHEGKPAVVTEKLAGKSMTAFLTDEKFGVCNKNLNLLRELPQLKTSIKLWYQLKMRAAGIFNKDSVIKDCGSYLYPEDHYEIPIGSDVWKVALRDNLEQKLRNVGENIAIQGELIGPGICDNIYQMEKQKLYIFSIYKIDELRYCNYYEQVHYCAQMNLDYVPFVENCFIHTNVDMWVRGADGASALNRSAKREGIVVRLLEPEGRHHFSFKAVSDKCLLLN
jgi:hypothetical protein